MHGYIQLTLYHAWLATNCFVHTIPNMPIRNKCVPSPFVMGHVHLSHWTAGKADMTVVIPK